MSRKPQTWFTNLVHDRLNVWGSISLKFRICNKINAYMNLSFSKMLLDPNRRAFALFTHPDTCTDRRTRIGQTCQQQWSNPDLNQNQMHYKIFYVYMFLIKSYYNSLKDYKVRAANRKVQCFYKVISAQFKILILLGLKCFLFCNHKVKYESIE